MSRSPRRDLAVLVAGFLAALALRLAFLAAPNDRYDLGSFRIVAGILDRGGDVYRETTRYNYSPVWAGVLWVLAGASKSVGISLDRAVTGLLLAGDAATALLLARIALGRGEPRMRAAFAALLFFANPVSVLTSSRLAMFDNLSVLFLLLAVRAMEAVPPRRAGAVAGMTASLLIKHVTWFHPLLLPRRREPRVGLPGALAPYALFLASFLPFWRSWDRIRSQVFGYQSMGEPYGTEPLRFLPGFPTWGTAAICVAAALAAAGWLWYREVEFGRASLLLFLVVLLLAPGIAVYYFVWPIALGALYPSAGYAVYTVIASLFLIHSPDALSVELPHLPGWSGPWWALLFWLLWEIRRLSGAGRAPAAAPRPRG
ncbi:MAG: hypothetical protein ACM3SU_13020 [Acidobacteriota bacterium]